MKIPLILLFTLALQARADGLGAPELFVPVHAADQAVITSKSLSYERSQFNELAGWKIQRDQLQSIRAERDKASEDFKRAQELAKSGRISQVELETRELEFNQMNSEVTRATIGVNRAKISFAISRQHLLEEGNPGLDVRKVIARLNRMGILRELLDLKSSRDSAISIQEYHKKRFEAGVVLQAKGIISKVDLEQRKSHLRRSEDQVKGLQHRIESGELALTAIDKSIQRL